MKRISNMSRRDFLKTGTLLGGGLILGISLPSCVTRQPDTIEPFAPNAFVRIGPDERITVVVNKSEMGQGVYTSLPMLLAEELEADWKTISVQAAPVDHAYDHTEWGPVQGTGGSSSIRSEWDRFREAGAAAREMLISAAADRWKVDRTSCRADSGRILHTSGKSLSFGELVEEAAVLPVPENVPLKAPSEFKMIGKAMPRLDTPDKSTGRAIFGIDVQVPNMLMAVIARPPVFGATVKAVDMAEAKTIPGVMDTFEVKAGVAVVADNTWAALRGRDALKIEWDEGGLTSLDTEQLRTTYAAMAKTPGLVARKDGDPEAVLERAAKTVEADYEVPYLAHACMEPLNCVADVQTDRCEIWTGTQFQTVNRNAAADIAGLKPEQVQLHTTYLGGGFGRRANPASDFVTEAVEVSKKAGRPVKVLWTREDDTRGGYYRPMWVDRIAAGLDQQGNITAWKHTIVGQSIIAGTIFEQGFIKDGIDRTSVEGAQDIPYAVENIRVELHSPATGVPVLWWRSVGHSHTAFVVETFMDELAHAAKTDPLAFRLRLLKSDEPHRAVLETAAERADWGTPVPAGRARGLAVHQSFGSTVAEVAEVSVSPKGEVRVHKVVCVVDCGRTVNPDTVKAQMESAIVFGLSAALHGALTFKQGRVQESNFHDYPILRMNEMPQVDVHIMPSDESPKGVGEPGVPPIAPAVANAIFAATGKRIRRLPISGQDLRKA